MNPSLQPTCDRGNRTLRWSQFCDGIFDCQDRSDEEGQFCKLCIDNLYSCSSEDELRCDLACKALHYVPCQVIQDRRACLRLQQTYDNYSPYRFLTDVNFYIAVAIATIVILLVATGITILIKYCIRTQRQRISRFTPKRLHLPTAPPPPYLPTPHRSPEYDRTSNHIYEQCYEPPPYKDVHKYPMTRTYYEHVL
ncbi:unnamed protein product [Adineta ricciae]|uniref:Uncharacterized protein n=1 Tax=Adineta ricciae TaxID=249248 RepID=A0A813Q4V1_ADIRI|nr:unnamed protein product [Adineta ricciae]CAF1035713.1 unnamed protein product [Adineta ricciae]